MATIKDAEALIKSKIKGLNEEIEGEIRYEVDEEDLTIFFRGDLDEDEAALKALLDDLHKISSEGGEEWEQTDEGEDWLEWAIKFEFSEEDEEDDKKDPVESRVNEDGTLKKVEESKTGVFTVESGFTNVDEDGNILITYTEDIQKIVNETAAKVVGKVLGKELKTKVGTSHDVDIKFPRVFEVKK